MVVRGLQQSEVYIVNNKTYILIAALMAIITLLLLSFYPVSLNNKKSLPQYSVYQCSDYILGCRADINNKKIEIKFPGDIVFLERFPVEVKLADVHARKITVEFIMVGMDMGLNFYQLKQSSNNKTIWTGEGVLPVCTTGRTDWQSIITIELDDKIQRVAFQFKVGAKT